MKWIFFSVLFLVSDWTKAEVTWPYGIYGLPKAKSGCPTSDGVTWSNGSRFQDMDDEEPYKSATSDGFHMDAEVDFGHRRDITRRFCMKTEFGSLKRNWPKGFYCVYKYSESACPFGMTQGMVRWDDEDDDNANKKNGVLPDGEYNKNTVLQYCCQEQGQWYNSIELPIDYPFYLLPHNSSSSPVCQIVKWALTWLEFIVYDTESHKNGDRSSGSHVFIKKSITDESLPKVYYCYYEGCRYQMTGLNGTFQSPKSELSNGYPKFQYCSWLLTVSATFVVSLNFTSFHVPNCDNNFVKIYDGVNDSAPILATYCGLNATSESSIISSANNVYVKANFGSYSSNNPRMSSNFEAEYSAQLNPTGCRYQITGNDGSFTSPMHFIPDGYPMFQYCSWLVKVNALFVLTLNFTYLKVSNCNESFVRIYDGSNDKAPALATLCDSNLPSERNISILSSTNKVYLVLKYGSNSKNLGVRPGFKIHYSTQLKPTASTTAKTTTTSNHSLPNNTLANQNKKNSSVTYIIVAVVVVAIVIIILAAVIAIIYWRRKRKQSETETESTFLRGLNPVYDTEKMAAVNPRDSNCYDTPTIPQEKIWVGGSRICKEGNNPIYEPAVDEAEPSTLYFSADNVTYEPTVEQERKSENPVYGDVSASPVYAEPTSPVTERHYDLPEISKNK